MKHFLLLALLTVLAVPAFAMPVYACEEACVPEDEATEETPDEDICVPHHGMVYINPDVMRNAFLQSYINKLEDLGGVYQEGWNRFDVMHAIFDIQKGL